MNIQNQFTERVEPGEHPGASDSFLDRQFANMSGFGLVLLLVILPGLAAILGIIGLTLCRNPAARERATIMLGVGAILTLIGFALMFGTAVR